MQFTTNICAEYIWLGGNNEFRSKNRTITICSDENDNHIKEDDILVLSNYPEWSYDGSSTNQAKGEDSEIILKPCAVYRDYSVNDSQYLLNHVKVFVLCETYYPNGDKLPNNHRDDAVKIFNQNKEARPWFGIEQEFYLTRTDDKYDSCNSKMPIGMYHAKKQGQYYCSVGANNAFGRYMVTKVYNICVNMGLKVSGMNAEVGPGQWEIQIGPCEGIESGDHLMMCRYILHKIGEEFDLQVNFDPKLVKGDWNGSGCHVNYSTKEMREDGGYEHIINAIEKLGKRHEEHMEWYGDGNEERMTGSHETASFNKFSYGVANRGASVRIPRQTEKDQKGYFEDRRPASNIDPYVVTSMLFETTVLK